MEHEFIFYPGDENDFVDDEYALEEDTAIVIQDSSKWGSGFTLWYIPSMTDMHHIGDFATLEEAKEGAVNFHNSVGVDLT